MATKLDPLISEFDTQEEADAYHDWFVKRVKESMDDPRPPIPHDQAMAEMRAIIEAAKARYKKRA